MSAKADQASARAELRELLPPGTTVHTILRHVSRSGMYRVISPVLVTDGSARDLTWLVARAGIAKRTGSNARHDGIAMGGCGMDMGFALVYSIARALYSGDHPFTCTGSDDCPANDHVNARGADRTAGYRVGRVHSDGGYALSHRWL